MKRYANVVKTIWADDKFTSLSDQEKLLFLYIITNPKTNILGIFQLPFEVIKLDLNWSMRTTKKHFNALVCKKMISFCARFALVCINNHLKLFPIRNENMQKNAYELAENLPVTELFFEPLKHLTDALHHILLKRLLKRLLSPFFPKHIYQNQNRKQNQVKTSNKPSPKDDDRGALAFEGQPPVVLDNRKHEPLYAGMKVSIEGLSSADRIFLERKAYFRCRRCQGKGIRETKEGGAICQCTNLPQQQPTEPDIKAVGDIIHKMPGFFNK